MGKERENDEDRSEFHIELDFDGTNCVVRPGGTPLAKDCSDRFPLKSISTGLPPRCP